jgi:hypothetical protein
MCALMYAAARLQVASLLAPKYSAKILRNGHQVLRGIIIKPFNAFPQFFSIAGLILIQLRRPRVNASVFVAVDVHYKKRKLKRFAKVPIALAPPTTKSDIGTPMRNPRRYITKCLSEEFLNHMNHL